MPRVEKAMPSRVSPRALWRCTQARSGQAGRGDSTGRPAAAPGARSDLLGSSTEGFGVPAASCLGCVVPLEPNFSLVTGACCRRRRTAWHGTDLRVVRCYRFVQVGIPGPHSSHLRGVHLARMSLTALAAARDRVCEPGGAGRPQYSEERVRRRIREEDLLRSS